MKFYNSIHTIPLCVFLDCYIDNNLSSLIIEGKPSEEKLKEAFFEIREQFINMMGSHEQKQYIKLLKTINIIAATKNQAISLIKIMEDAYHPLIAKQLNGILKISITWHDQNRTIIDAGLRRATMACVPLDMQLASKQAALNKLDKKMQQNPDRQEPKREQFDLLLNQIEEHFQVQIDHNITLSRFCNKVIRMREWQRRNSNNKYARSTRR